MKGKQQQKSKPKIIIYPLFFLNYREKGQKT
jgi:hypothetical protein